MSGPKHLFSVMYAVTRSAGVTSKAGGNPYAGGTYGLAEAIRLVGGPVLDGMASPSAASRRMWCGHVEGAACCAATAM
jgi:hypothetical protein